MSKKRKQGKTPVKKPTATKKTAAVRKPTPRKKPAAPRKPTVKQVQSVVNARDQLNKELSRLRSRAGRSTKGATRIKREIRDTKELRDLFSEEIKAFKTRKTAAPTPPPVKKPPVPREVQRARRERDAINAEISRLRTKFNRTGKKSEADKIRREIKSLTELRDVFSDEVKDQLQEAKRKKALQNEKRKLKARYKSIDLQRKKKEDDWDEYKRLSNKMITTQGQINKLNQELGVTERVTVEEIEEYINTSFDPKTEEPDEDHWQAIDEMTVWQAMDYFRDKVYPSVNYSGVVFGDDGGSYGYDEKGSMLVASADFWTKASQRGSDTIIVVSVNVKTKEVKFHIYEP